MTENIKLCECGCGQEVKSGSRFIRGHHARVKSEETRRKLSKSMIGKNKGNYHSVETRKLISDRKKENMNDETRRKISEAALKRKPIIETTRIKMSKSHKGFKHSEESKKKMSKAQKGKIVSEKTRKKMSNAKKGSWTGEKNPNYGKTISDEVKKKISEANKGRFVGKLNGNYGKEVSLEMRKKISERNTNPSDETRKKMSEARKGTKASDETRKKMSDARCGEKNPNFGKKMSEEQKRKISEARNGKYGGENNPAWKGGISFEPYCSKFNDNLKEKVRNRDNRNCQNCGVKENGRKHSVHHIHYDKENCYPDLITLCISCNVKANNNRDYWEAYYINKLNDRGLLFWTKNNI